MLNLGSPEWGRLRHAYGSADDIPALLSRLRHDPVNGDAWDDLWSALCHQSDVFDATYAALPHVVAVLATLPAEQRVPAANFVGSAVACAARGSAPPVPPELLSAYEAAQSEADRLLLETLAVRSWGTEDYRVLFGALAAVRGEAALALDVFEAGTEWSCTECGGAIRPYSSEVLGAA